MRILARPTPTSTGALAIAVIAAISALFASTAIAKEEAIEAVPASVPAVEVPVSPEPTAAPEPVDTPEVASVADSAGEVESAVAASSSEPVASDGGVPVSTPPLSTPAPPDAVPAGAVSDAVRAVPVEVDPQAHVETEPDTTVSTTVHRVSSVVARVAEDAPVAEEAQWANETLANAPARLLSDATAPARGSLGLIESATAPARDGLGSIAAPGEAALLAVADEAAAVFATPPAVDHGVPSQPSANPTPSFSKPLPIGALLGHRAGGPGGLLAKFMAGFGGVEPPSLVALRGLLSDPMGSLSPAITASRGSDADQHFNGPTPLEDPGQLPGSPGATAPGTGASFFVPLAALLALLALAAPAILRRFREVPDFRSPTPFVCALERPG